MEDIVLEKASYCLNCKIKPCSVKGCPLNNDIPSFIKAIKEQEYNKAYEILCKTTVLPGVCGRICPHMKQCQGSCVRGIKGKPVSIGDLEAFVFDKAIEEKLTLKDCMPQNENEDLKDKKVAVIGGGPAGLTCAAFLAKEGIQVTIFEKYDYLGGILVHGIPDFRLDKKIVENTVKQILNLGIKVEYGQNLGQKLKLEEIEKIISLVEEQDRIGVCLDTCHLHDAGYDMDHFDEFLDLFDSIIGLDKVHCVHVNDSKNPVASHKDRHENIGFGDLGFDTLCRIIYHPKLEMIPKILETPYVDGIYAPYGKEIEMIRSKTFNPNLIEEIRKKKKGSMSSSVGETKN